MQVMVGPKEVDGVGDEAEEDVVGEGGDDKASVEKEESEIVRRKCIVVGIR